ncbi:MAG TPA: class I SAM-dependent methyltransferase [bacterium]|jgi:ubiquinone/menaquinone biosynthesis C-methylase UbiE|nr:class I SAM-dependent methyltransferase [bacterium]HPO11229.1 class I SAM-dependent methyltransferase [bacterium]
MTKINLLEEIKNSYNKISDNFNITRKNNWDDFNIFKKYLLDFKNEKIKILDIGCGNGRLIKFLNELNLNYEYVGIDNSRMQIKNALKNFGNQKNVKFIEADALAIPFNNNEFDLIFCIATFHHLPSFENKNNALREMRRVLKDGGLIFMTNWNLFQKKYILNTIKNLRNDFIPWKNNKGEILASRYYYAFTKRELENIFLKNNFQILENNFSENKNFLQAKNIISIIKK